MSSNTSVKKRDVDDKSDKHKLKRKKTDDANTNKGFNLISCYK